MPTESSSINLLSALMTIIPVLFLVAVNIVMGILCYIQAKSRGFNPVAALFAGLVGGLLTLLIILMFPNKQAEPCAPAIQNGQV